jgi:diaminopimelate decarboxylase
VAHEVTHAVINGIRTHFTEATNPDLAAFHEAFADLVALFRHFTHQEVLLDTIERTGGMLYRYQLQPEGPRPRPTTSSKPRPRRTRKRSR